MKKLIKIAAVVIALCVFSACAGGKAEYDFDWSTENMVQVTDTAEISLIKQKMGVAVMSLSGDWSVEEAQPGMGGLSFRDAAQQLYYEEYGSYIWEEDMYVPVERYVEQSQKIFGFSEEQVRRIVTAGKGVYDEERDMVPAADGYGHNLTYTLKEVWTDGNMYLIIYDYGAYDFELGEITESYEGMACARKNEKGDIIFLANRNGMAAAEDLRL